MKVLLANVAGVTGKTTIARNMLMPRMPGASLISIEALNADGREDSLHTAAKLTEAMMASDEVDDAVIDLGASESRMALEGASMLEGWGKQFDVIIIPASADPRVIRDATTTVRHMRALGAPQDRIKILVNRVDLAEFDAEPFLQYSGLAASGAVTNPEWVIGEAEIFADIAVSGASIADLANDRQDWRALLRACGDDKEARRAISIRKTLQMKAAFMQKHLDTVFASIMEGVGDHG